MIAAVVIIWIELALLGGLAVGRAIRLADIQAGLAA
jgi:hypothetical protein